MNSSVHQFPWMPCEAPECPHSSAQLLCGCTSTAAQPSPSGPVCHMDPITGARIQQQTGEPLCAQYTQLLFLASIWPVTLPPRSTTAGLAASKPPQLTPPTKSMHEQAGAEDAASTLMQPLGGIISKFQTQNPASEL